MSGPERWRGPVLLLCVLLLVLLCARYGRMASQLPDGVQACLADPARHDGTPLVFPVWFVAGVDGPARYRVSRVVKDVVVEGDTRGLERGQTFTLVGRFRAQDAVVVEERREIHRLRPWKTGISLLGLLLAGIGAPLCFRWRGGFLELRPARGRGGPDA